MPASDPHRPFTHRDRPRTRPIQTGGVHGAAVVTSRSTDGGLTWSSLVTTATGANLDKNCHEPGHSTLPASPTVDTYPTPPYFPAGWLRRTAQADCWDMERCASSSRRHHRHICAAQKACELGGVGHRLIAEAVVHEYVDLAGLLGQVLDFRDPLGQLVLVVEVAEPFGDGLLLPGFGVAAVEADDREGGGGGFGDGGDRGAEALGHVDADEGEVVLAEEGQGAVAVVVGGHPGGVAELDADLVAGEAVADGGQLLAAGAAGGEPLRLLHQDGAELAGRVQGEEGVAEAAPDLGLAVGRQMRGVEAFLVAVLGGDLVEQVLGDGLAAGGVAGEEAERLDVEDEVGRGALDPQAGLLLAGQVVVGGVDLDDRELGGVEAQTGLGVAGALGVPA